MASRVNHTLTVFVILDFVIVPFSEFEVILLTESKLDDVCAKFTAVVNV